MPMHAPTQKRRYAPMSAWFHRADFNSLRCLQNLSTVTADVIMPIHPKKITSCKKGPAHKPGRATCNAPEGPMQPNATKCNHSLPLAGLRLKILLTLARLLTD
jgi:hypothetical protein